MTLWNRDVFPLQWPPVHWVIVCPRAKSSLMEVITLLLTMDVLIKLWAAQQQHQHAVIWLLQCVRLCVCVCLCVCAPAGVIFYQHDVAALTLLKQVCSLILLLQLFNCDFVGNWVYSVSQAVSTLTGYSAVNITGHYNECNVSLGKCWSGNTQGGGCLRSECVSCFQLWLQLSVQPRAMSRLHQPPVTCWISTAGFSF